MWTSARVIELPAIQFHAGDAAAEALSEIAADVPDAATKLEHVRCGGQVRGAPDLFEQVTPTDIGVTAAAVQRVIHRELPDRARGVAVRHVILHRRTQLDVFAILLHRFHDSCSLPTGSAITSFNDGAVAPDSHEPLWRRESSGARAHAPAASRKASSAPPGR